MTEATGKKPRPGLRIWSVYAGASAAIIAVVGLAAAWALEPGARTGAWAGLGVAWLVQLVAFAVLILAARRTPGLFVAGWTAGTFLRLAALGLIAWWVVSNGSLAPLPTLLALAGALFALLLLEPIVFRTGVGAR